MAEKTIAIIGGGVIGLASAWRLARRGHHVTVYERDEPGRAASHVAAGMLAPVSEYGFENEDFLALGRRSMARYPGFLEELAADGGAAVDLDTRGTLSVALDRDDAEALRRVCRFRESRDLPVQWMAGSDAREIEPLLSPKVIAGMWIPDDYQVNNRQLVDALAAALRALGGEIRDHTPVHTVTSANERVSGVETDAGLEPADVVVVAAGCWSGGIEGIPDDARPPVRPVKGQIVSLREDPGVPLGRVIRTPDCYLVPKGDGRLLIGATEEDMGYDVTPTAGPIMRLIERAWEAVPAIYDLPFDHVDVGLRPGSRDHLPIVGETSLGGLVMATGHYRHGILLAPVTADVVCDGIDSGGFDPAMAAFSPGRFARS